MIIDTSAIIAIVLHEPEEPAMLNAIACAEQTSMSAGTWLELEAVITRRAVPGLAQAAQRLLADMEIKVVGLSVDQARLGRIGYQTYGRGTGHPAGLNFGDCFAYALAKETGRPLLFKGDDFTHTDVAPAV